MNTEILIFIYFKQYSGIISIVCGNAIFVHMYLQKWALALALPPLIDLMPPLCHPINNFLDPPLHCLKINKIIICKIYCALS